MNACLLKQSAVTTEQQQEVRVKERGAFELENNLKLTGPSYSKHIQIKNENRSKIILILSDLKTDLLKCHKEDLH